MTNQPSVNSTPQDQAKSPNLMDLVLNEEWLRAAAHAEEAAGCDIQAGYTGAYLREFMTDPVYFQKMRQMQAIVLTELRELLNQFDLGIGIEAAFVCGKQIILEKLHQPSVEIQTQLWFVLEAYEASQEKILSQSLKAEVKKVLQDVLTQEDWQEIAEAVAVSVRSHVLEYGQLQAS
jgi:hypothetical protein